MNDIYHDKNAIHDNKYILNYIRNRKRIVEVKYLFQNLMALLDKVLRIDLRGIKSR